MKRDFVSVLVEQCAPTLAGIKAANLFRFDGLTPTERRRETRHWDAILSPAGLRLRVVKVCPQTGSFLVYVYRTDWVDRLLSDEENCRFLAQLGYECGDTRRLIAQLSRRLCLQKDFPHEVGIFLGYPLRDVEGFIDNNGRNFTVSGDWKAYGDPVEARAYFDRCKRCKQQYSRLYEQGTPLLNLIVAA